MLPLVGTREAAKVAGEGEGECSAQHGHDEHCDGEAIAHGVESDAGNEWCERDEHRIEESGS